MSNDEIVSAKEHFRYGISHDIFKEPVTSYAKTALWAFDEVFRLQKEVQNEKNKTVKEFKTRLISNIDDGELYESNNDYWMTIEHINAVEKEIIKSQ